MTTYDSNSVLRACGWSRALTGALVGAGLTCAVTVAVLVAVLPGGRAVTLSCVLKEPPAAPARQDGYQKAALPPVRPVVGVCWGTTP